MSFRCSDAAEQRGDPLLATAAPVTRWLLIEEPGPWGQDGLLDCRIDPAVAAALAGRAGRANVRVQLIRRSGRGSARPALRRWAIADARPGWEVTRWGRFAADHELLDLPIEAELSSVDGSTDPLYLVCTHGRKDVCCALRGRPVAALLAAHRPEETWETSHVGGDRFAANLVVLPHGLYYGYVSPEAALDLVKAHETGHVVTELLRGRSCYPVAVQAAQWYARRELGETRLDALRPVHARRVDPTTWRIDLSLDSGAVAVGVRAVRSPDAVRLTCAAHRPAHYRTFALTGLWIEDGPGSRS